MNTIKLELSLEELKALKYHLSYDINTIREHLCWEDLELDKDTSENLLNKVEMILEKKQTIEEVQEIQEMILELADEQEELSRSDFQGRAYVVAFKIIELIKNNK